ncbi:HNH endonuclease signature motif containing protein [Gordonia phthalatica]|uniref:HNH endonuclease n=1 Tax=Gordonia phthalatica TaxID=1136941 RepID=A0A0N9NDS5_9ACTN|nr:HNH endonuclease signature motif containing protein [Gordonia phthalatica]ALG85838.1 HNH endonuclease [Gordonia phthalatica]
MNCSWEGCDRAIHSRGYCGSHYNRAIKEGILLRRRDMPFWEVDGSGCWIWNRKIRPDGYGRKSLGKYVQVPAHRWVYEQCVGPIPDGLELDHLCNVRACVNPDHLEPVTHTENMLRQWRRKRAA